ncbi:MAG: hypothetical protein KDG44_15920 [Burkholderiaceae bacterium]|nr:hypothetical protein [Burkholderiaceae bacterium]
MIDLRVLGLPPSGPSRTYDTSTDGTILGVNSGIVRGISVNVSTSGLSNIEAFRRLLPRVVKAVFEAAKDNIAQVATSGEFMRPAWGERQWRSPGDTGPLRIGPGRLDDYDRKAPFDPGRLSRSLIGERSNVAGNEQIMEWQETDDTIQLTYGTRVPYARLQEFGGRTILPWNGHEANIPPRPYFRPAISRTEPWLREAMQVAVDELIQHVEAA